MNCTNVYPQYNDDYGYDSVLNEIPKCPKVDYCQAAAFRFNLPSCEKNREENEYLAFVVPRRKTGHERPQSQYHTQTSQPQVTHQPSRDCRWDTEYRGTIDECARKVMNSQQQSKRSPIYPRNGIFEPNKAPSSAASNLEKSKRERLHSTLERREPHSSSAEKRFPSEFRKVSSVKKEPLNLKDSIRPKSRSIQQPVRRLTGCHKPLMIEPFVIHDESPESYLLEECKKHEKTTKKPFCSCIPADEKLYPVQEHPQIMNHQRSSARPMKKCQFVYD